MVEGAALEMLCGETHPGFESLTLRQKSKSQDLDFSFMSAGHNFVTREASTSFDSLLSTSLSACGHKQMKMPYGK